MSKFMTSNDTRRQSDMRKNFQQTFSCWRIRLLLRVLCVQARKLLVVALQFPANDKLNQGQNSQGYAHEVVQAHYLIISFNEQWVQRQRNSLEAMKSSFYRPLLPVAQHRGFKTQLVIGLASDIGLPRTCISTRR